MEAKVRSLSTHNMISDAKKTPNLLVFTDPSDLGPEPEPEVPENPCGEACQYAKSFLDAGSKYQVIGKEFKTTGMSDVEAYAVSTRGAKLSLRLMRRGFFRWYEVEKSADSLAELALEFEASKLEPSLLRRCPSKTVLFGCIDNGNNAIENPRDIADKLLAAAEYLPPTQIQAAPDCGLVPLPLDIARLKLKVMVEGAKLARQEF